VTAIAKALRGCASGILTAEAGVSLLVNSDRWLHRDDFTSQFVVTATTVTDSSTLMASIDWPTAITGLENCRLACSGERHMLRLAASIAAGTPVSLCGTRTGIDLRNPEFLIAAMRHAAGQRLPS
jgi:hypothetical protein